MEEVRNRYFLSPHPTVKIQYVYKVLRSTGEVEGRKGLTAVLVRSQGALFCFVLT